LRHSVDHILTTSPNRDFKKTREMDTEGTYAEKEVGRHMHKLSKLGLSSRGIHNRTLFCPQ